MNRKVLVAYASTKGSTREIANVIGAILRLRGSVVDVLPADQVTDLSLYRGVVLGSPIYNGRWMGEAVEFVEGHRRALQRMPAALFVVSMTMTHDDAHSRLAVLGYLDPVLKLLPNVHDEDVGLFAGVFDPTRWSPISRLFMKYNKLLRYGDFRRWDVIQQWTDYIDDHILRRRERETAA